ncbi:MAG TPA: glycosyltransferase [Terriglobia bacterium]|nr:glycosyltransferase [Terriglobia bacterium]
MNASAKLKVALVHHWLVTRRGGERVFEALAELFPAADIFTLVFGGPDVLPALRNRTVRSSFLQRLPRSTRWYPYYLPLFPAAAARLDLTGYDLVISSDAAVVKGVQVNPRAVHICYCHTPMRYVWTGYETYSRTMNPAVRLAFSAMAGWLRRWDFDAAQRVTTFVANSRNVQERIRNCYARESVVIYPPVDTEQFVIGPAHDASEDFFLVVSQLVPYKRIDLVVEAFNQCGRNLVIIGDGPDRRELERRAKSNVRFLGSQPQETVVRAMQQCKAFVFAGDEDFGIVLAEAQACGKPVIAFAEGGALEIVRPGITGILFEEQSVKSLVGALEQFDSRCFEATAVRKSALRFGQERFLQEFSTLCEETINVPTRSAWNDSFRKSQMPESNRFNWAEK